MGVLANHVPSIEQLKPGLIEVFEESGSSKQFFCTFTPNPASQGNKMGMIGRICDAEAYEYLLHVIVSGGFAVVQPNSALSINAVEAYSLEDFSAEAVRAQISESQKVANGSGSEQDIAEAKIELEVSLVLEIIGDCQRTC